MPSHSRTAEIGRADLAVKSDAEMLSRELFNLRARLFPPSASKELRSFTSGEAASLLGVRESYLKHLRSGDGQKLQQGSASRRLYTLQQINELRRRLSAEKGSDSLPARRGREHLQVIAVTNFKGGSGKTTTSAHSHNFWPCMAFESWLSIWTLSPACRPYSEFNLRPICERMKRFSQLSAMTISGAQPHECDQTDLLRGN